MTLSEDRIEGYEFRLPEAAIAQHPADRREESRLLRLARDGETHGRFGDILDHLAPGDLLVLNDTRVMKARMMARRATGGQVELLFCEAIAPDCWTAMVRPGRKARPGDILHVADVALEVLEVRPDGLRIIRTPATLPTHMERHGILPVPPYIREQPLDPERYQTVYARETGSIAAPTAGLHLTRDLLGRLAERGVRSTTLTLHVGLGTFLPVKADHLDAHVMHAERYTVPVETADLIRTTKASGGRVIAVGTTTTRTLEAVAATHGEVVPCSGSTNLFIRPGYPFRVLDGLITNFHLPRSTLVVLVSALAGHLGLGGRSRILAAYADAVARGYRFFSFGDAMLLLP
jgi:S-adenosylmethionine:tRNA ribosyltransferase-isomerase